MSLQSGSSRFGVLFESALQDYQKQTGMTLAEHPFAEQPQNYQSVESVTALLQGQAQTLGEFKGSDRIMKSLKSIASVLFSLSASTALGGAIGLVRLKVLIRFSVSLTLPLQPLPPIKAINAAISVLLGVCSVLLFLCAYLVTAKSIRLPLPRA